MTAWPSGEAEGSTDVDPGAGRAVATGRGVALVPDRGLAVGRGVGLGDDAAAGFLITTRAGDTADSDVDR